MTYSILARDPETGAFGMAVQSHFFGVGRLVGWLEPGLGGVATQANRAGAVLMTGSDRRGDRG